MEKAKSGTSHAWSFIRIIRPVNIFIIVLAQYFTAIFLLGPSTEWQQYFLDLNLFFICISTLAIAAAGYIINDYYDIKIDLINKPEEVVIGTSLTRRSAMIAHTLLNLLGIMIGALVSPLIAIINFLAAFLLWLYSNQLKRMAFVGNLTVGILTGMAIFIIPVHFRHSYLIVSLYALFALLITLAREIIKDMEDIKGDQKFGSKTLPILIGFRKTKIVIYSLSIIFLVFVIYLVLTSRFPGREIILYAFLVPLFLLNYLLLKADTKKDFSNLSEYAKWFMLVGILSMIFL